MCARVGVRARVHTIECMCVLTALRNQKRVLDPLEQEFQIVVSREPNPDPVH